MRLDSDEVALPDAEFDRRAGEWFPGAVCFLEKTHTGRNGVFSTELAGQVPGGEVVAVPGIDPPRPSIPRRVKASALVVGAECLLRVLNSPPTWVRAECVADARVVLLADGQALAADTPAVFVPGDLVVPDGARLEIAADGSAWALGLDGRASLIRLRATTPPQPIGDLCGASDGQLFALGACGWHRVELLA